MITITNTHTAPELASEDAWYKSSYSNDTGGSCVELAAQTTVAGAVAVRDSKNKTGPALVLTPSAWMAFIAAVQTGEFDSDLIA